nr:1460_t:CDS:2 [Entrophospora candida]
MKRHLQTTKSNSEDGGRCHIPVIHNNTEHDCIKPSVLFQQPSVLFRQPSVLHRQPSVLHRQPSVLHRQPSGPIKQTNDSGGIGLMAVNSFRGKNVRIACNHCRKKHIKCDDNQPSCKNCEKKGLTCEREQKQLKRGRPPGLPNGMGKKRKQKDASP